MLLACCCTDCCQLCIGKQCNAGVNWNLNFDGAGAGNDEDNSGEANIDLPFSPLTGGRFSSPQNVGGLNLPITKASEQCSATPYCLFTQVCDDVYFVHPTLGSIGIYVTPTIHIFRGNTSGDLIVYFETFFWTVGASTMLNGEASFGTYVMQDCAACSFEVPLSVVYTDNSYEDYISPPTTLTLTSSYAP